jgi:hypothetical protein
MLETYSWLIVPVQPDPTGPIEYQAHRIAGQDNFYERAARKLRQSELLITRWSPDNLRIELDRYLWREEPHLGLKQLWEYLARYCYLPRLYNEEVLLDAVRDGVSRLDAPFGYATMVTQDGRYSGLALREMVARLYFNDNDVIVHPEAAQQQLDNEQQQTVQLQTIPSNQQVWPPEVTQYDPPKPKPITRYHGTVSLDPQRVNKDIAVIVAEVVERLTSLTGTEVEITVEISANRPSGFDEATIRTINENSRTLKFRGHGFETD